MRISSHRSVPGKSAGFTLLEMVITLSIFILLAAAVFGIMTGVLQGASSLQDNQNRHDQVAALNAFLKKKLSELPAQSGLISYRRGNGEGLVQNGIAFGDDRTAIAIDAKVQANGYYTLRMTTWASSDDSSEILPGPLARFLAPMVEKDDPTLNWIPLIRDVQHVDWKFQDTNTTQWVDLWNNSSAKPNLVEFSMELAEDLQPVSMDFWLPRIDPVSLTVAPQPVTPPTTNAP